MPPPNITGKLHMGHALFLSIQDSFNRYYKITGRESLWAPGLDHAGLATHDKILEEINKSGLSYKEASKKIEDKHKEIILNQIKKSGALPDWRFFTYTLDYNDLIINILNEMDKQKRLKTKERQTFLNLQDYAKRLLKDINNNTFNIIPNKKINDLIPFLEDFQDWNITRDIPWGTKNPFNEKQSLDTWFNSSLWCFAIIHKHPELKDFYPASMIETGADILFFWCARMLIMSSWAYDNQEKLGLKLNTRYCFDTIYLHGIIRDSDGIKMSKSIGNGIDPLDLIDSYGADAMRIFLLTRSGPSEDIIWNDNDLIGMRNFINKIYQSGRFLSIASNKRGLLSLDKENIQQNKYFLEIKKKYILLMEDQRILEASRFIISKFKNDFCNDWLEKNKDMLFKGDIAQLEEALLIYKDFLLMLHPFCPYITDYLLEEFYY